MKNTLTPDAETLERERLARRQAIRQKMAKAEMTETRLSLLATELAKVDEQKETAADLHQAVCTPLQAELETLEAEAVQRITDRQTPDQAADKRRSEIVVEIAEHNQELEEAVSLAKVRKKPLNREIQKLKAGHMSPKVLQLELGKDHTADPALLVQRFVNSRSVQFATARVNSARKSLKICRYNHEEIEARRMSGDAAACQRRIDNWTAEISDAERIVAESNREGERIHTEMLNE